MKGLVVQVEQVDPRGHVGQFEAAVSLDLPAEYRLPAQSVAGSLATAVEPFDHDALLGRAGVYVEAAFGALNATRCLRRYEQLRASSDSME